MYKNKINIVKRLLPGHTLGTKFRGRGRGRGIFKVSMDSGLFHYLQRLMVDLLRSFGTHSSHNRPRCPTNMCLPIVLLPGIHNLSPLTHSSQCHAIFAGSRLTRLGYGLMFLVNKPRSVPQTIPGFCSLHWRPSSLRTQTMSFTYFFSHSEARTQPGT